MRYAYERNLPVTTRGSGTGLCGACVPIHGGILLSTARLNRILEIDTDNLMATVEPGVILLDFQETVEKLGFLRSDPGEKCHHRRQCGYQCRRHAGSEVWGYQGPCNRLGVVLPNGDIVQLEAGLPELLRVQLAPSHGGFRGDLGDYLQDHSQTATAPQGLDSPGTFSFFGPGH